MKTTMAVLALAATAGTADAGLCCCTTYLLSSAISYQGYDCTGNTWATYPQADCKGTPSASTTYDCTGTTNDASNCAKDQRVAGSGIICTWNSAASTALASAAVAASVIAYAL